MDGHTITIEDTGIQFVCGEDEFILRAMIHRGAGPIAHGCCGGGCGVCRMRVVSGEVAHVKRMSREHVTQADEDAGIVLICCIQPRADVTLAPVGETTP